MKVNYWPLMLFLAWTMYLSYMDFKAESSHPDMSSSIQGGAIGPLVRDTIVIHDTIRLDNVRDVYIGPQK